jgi:hypothetical protein
VQSSFPSAFPRAANHWHPGDELNEVQAFLLTQNAPLGFVALAAHNPPSKDVASSYDFPCAQLARPRPRLRLIKGGRK